MLTKITEYFSIDLNDISAYSFEDSQLLNTPNSISQISIFLKNSKKIYFLNERATEILDWFNKYHAENKANCELLESIKVEQFDKALNADAVLKKIKKGNKSDF